MKCGKIYFVTLRFATLRAASLNFTLRLHTLQGTLTEAICLVPLARGVVTELLPFLRPHTLINGKIAGTRSLSCPDHTGVWFLIISHCMFTHAHIRSACCCSMPCTAHVGRSFLLLPLCGDHMCPCMACSPQFPVLPYP